MKVLPKTNQIFYVLFDENKNMLHSINGTHIFTTPFITKAMCFESKTMADSYNKINNLLFDVVRVKPQYELTTP